MYKYMYLCHHTFCYNANFKKSIPHVLRLDVLALFSYNQN